MERFGDPIIGLMFVLLLGLTAQWMAWALRLSSILLLLIVGVLVGPVFHLINPDEIFGPYFHPVISLAVAFILFEGGLSLKFSELKKASRLVVSLLTIGTFVTWILTAFFAYKFLGFDIKIALLFGSIFVVTGPTVIIPILRHLRLSGKIGPVLKWEGIVNDPIGVILSIIVFEAILAKEFHYALGPAMAGFAVRILLGTTVGLLSGWFLIFMFRKHLVPQFLEIFLTTTFVILSFESANHFYSEAGLVAVTVFGIFIANQKSVFVQRIAEFKENLRVIIIAVLFIVLSARLELNLLFPIPLPVILFFVCFVFLVRPVAVFLSGIGSGFKFREKFFMATMAPRGIVAAAMASFFALSLESLGYSESQDFLAKAFFLIAATIAFYGTLAAPLAHFLGLAKPKPQGVLILGAHAWARNLANTLRKVGIKVLLIDFDEEDVRRARHANLLAVTGNILSENFIEQLDLSEMGHFLALTANDEVNSLAASYFSKIFGKAHVYQLPPFKRTDKEERIKQHFYGQILFGENITYEQLDFLNKKNSIFQVVKGKDFLPKEDSSKDSHAVSQPFLLVAPSGQLKIATVNERLIPAEEDQVIFVG